MNESLMYGFEDEYKVVTLMLSLISNANGDVSSTSVGRKTCRGKKLR